MVAARFQGYLVCQRSILNSNCRNSSGLLLWLLSDRHQCPLHVIFQLFASGELLARLVDDLPDSLSNLGIKCQQFFILLDTVSNPILRDAAGYLSMLFRPLAELLPLSWIVSRL